MSDYFVISEKRSALLQNAYVNMDFHQNKNNCLLCFLPIGSDRIQP